MREPSGRKKNAANAWKNPNELDKLQGFPRNQGDRWQVPVALPVAGKLVPLPVFGIALGIGRAGGMLTSSVCSSPGC